MPNLEIKAFKAIDQKQLITANRAESVFKYI